jgi:hypothetical protein
VGILSRARRSQCTFYNGAEWAKPAQTPLQYPVQVVSCGTDIYAIAARGAQPFWRFDGKSWKPLTLPNREDYPRTYRVHGNSPGVPEYVGQQYFSVCGDTVVFVEPDKTGRKILCWRKPKEEEWIGPHELVTEHTPIADIVAPRYAVTAFVPVAYNCWSDERKASTAIGSFKVHHRREIKPWIKVLKVLPE